MIKYYHVHTGIKKTRRLRNTFVATTLVVVMAMSSVLITSLETTVSDQLTTNDQTAWLTNSSVESLPQIDNQIPWPSYGQAAYGVPEKDIYATSKQKSNAVPIASLTKVITALAVLEKTPLEKGEQGPEIVINQQDEELFNTYLQKDGVVLPVEVGTKITQYQALQASLLVSANNITDTLVISTFGSVDEYVAYANTMLKNQGLEKTFVADASGFSPKSVSTPEEMAKLGYLYMQHPVLREIALQKNADFPLVGTIENSNAFANDENTVGIKIGYTDEAGRTYMAAKINKDANDTENISIAVVLGADNLAVAAKDAIAVLKAGDASQPAPRP